MRHQIKSITTKQLFAVEHKRTDASFDDVGIELGGSVVEEPREPILLRDGFVKNVSSCSLATSDADGVVIFWSRRLGHPFDIGWALTWGTYDFDYRREPDRLLSRVHEAERVGREHRIPLLDHL